MNKRQVEWASRHDWFVKEIQVGRGEYRVVVREILSTTVTAISFFDSFQELRSWAGY